MPAAAAAVVLCIFIFIRNNNIIIVVVIIIIMGLYYNAQNTEKVMHLSSANDRSLKVHTLKVKVHTLDIAPHRSESPPQKRSGAQVWHVFSRDFTVLPAHPHVYPQSEWAIPAFAFPAATGTHLPTPEGWKAE